MNRDLEHLHLLSLFHFVLGGFLFLFSCFPFLHVAIGVLVLTETIAPPEAFPPFIGWFFVLFPSIFILVGWTMAALLLVAGLRLRQHRARMFCIVVAAFECLFVPFGTVLGVFTIVVLSRDSIARRFEGNPFGPPHPEPGPYSHHNAPVDTHPEG